MTPATGKELNYSEQDELAVDQLVGGVKAYQGNDLQLVWEDGQPHWD